MSTFDTPHFQNDEAARKYLEAIRWVDGPVCPHCGSTDRNGPLNGKSHRPGLYKCYQKECGGHFTVTVGTLFERSKVPLHKWFQAVYLLCSSKKGISSHQLHRMLGVTYKTAWFMTHRIREGMRDNMFTGQIGGGGRVVEADETFIGHDKTKKPKRQKKGRGYAHKEKVLTLIERGGEARSFHVPEVNADTLKPILKEQIAADTTLYTDEAGQYKWAGKHFVDHDFVRHGIGEYVRGDVHTNTMENYFSIFKRGMKGIYQHCSKRHLRRYLAEFDFRYNNRGVTDVERTAIALKGIEGKRLTYQQSHVS